MPARSKTQKNPIFPLTEAANAPRDELVCDGEGCACVPEARQDCCGADLCWFDSCGHVGEKVANCEFGCQAAHCVACSAWDCTGKECGDDGCGGSCGQCNAENTCEGLVWKQASLCQNGQCVGGADLNCDDENPCTMDECVPSEGCTYRATGDGEICQAGMCEGLVWNSPGLCAGGVCANGQVESCSDDLACTVDSCSSINGCSRPIKAGFCLIEETCFENGESPLEYPCLVCNAAESTVGWTHKVDGTDCGTDDWCQAGACVCKPDCAGRQCGLDPACGTSVCGTCESGYGCDDGQCIEGGGCSFDPVKFPANGRLAGDPCKTDGQCATELCATTERFGSFWAGMTVPDGWCTIIGCGSDADCGAGRLCLNFSNLDPTVPSMCTSPCETDKDCRCGEWGYVCIEGVNKGCVPETLANMLTCGSVEPCD